MTAVTTVAAPVAQTKKGSTKNRKLEEIYFPVETVDMEETCNRGYAFSSDCRYQVVIYPKKYPNGYVTYVGSKRYQYYENSTIVPEVEKVLNENRLNYKVYVRTYNHSQFHIKFVIQKPKPFGKGILTPVIHMYNSYDGKIQLSFQFSTSYQWNGQVIDVTDSPKLKELIDSKSFRTFFAQKHTNLDNLRVNLAEMMKNLNEFLQIDTMEDMKKLQEQTVRRIEFQKFFEKLCKNSGYPFSKIYKTVKGEKELNEDFANLIYGAAGGYNSYVDKFSIYLGMYQFLDQNYNYNPMKFNKVMGDVMLNL